MKLCNGKPNDSCLTAEKIPPENRLFDKNRESKKKKGEG